MCGLSGFLSLDGDLGPDAASVTEALSRTLVHRGPDQHGVWCEGPVALGHRRLAILDPREIGKQPMISGDGRWVIVFNGQIYNFKELRADLGADVHYKTTTDTEVMLEAIAAWGLEAAVRRFNGIFAFAAWDRKTRTLHLARDRMGIKPLYWARFGNCVLFASELKAFKAHPAWTGEIDQHGMRDYLDNLYISAPRTVYRSCWKLPPASVLTVKPQSGVELVPRPYWSLNELARDSERRKFGGSLDDATDALDDLLHDVINDQMVADVPLGAFLSGGIDSSVIVAIMRRKRPLKTFCVGYDEADFDESDWASKIAQYLDTEHVDIRIGPQDAADVIPRLPAMYDEPFADASAVPTHIVSRLASTAITVALSGDGGDELFGGYPRYLTNMNNWGRISWLPRPLRGVAASLIDVVPPDIWRVALRPLLRDASRSLPLAADMLRMETLGVYEKRMNYLGLTEAIKIPASVRRDNEAIFAEPTGLAEPFEQMMYLDQLIRLPDQGLTKVDRASMCCPIEVRTPLLDNRLIDFSWSLPRAFKIDGGLTKLALRKVLGRYLPTELFERPKTGFHIPMKTWMRGPLRGWAGDLVNSGLLRDDPYLDANAFELMWRDYLAGNGARSHAIWGGLSYLAWKNDNSRSFAMAA